VHRPSLRREDSPCQPGAVYTWHIVAVINVGTKKGELSAPGRDV
jgi:hypothetical protein